MLNKKKIKLNPETARAYSKSAMNNKIMDSSGKDHSLSIAASTPHPGSPPLSK